MTLTDAEKAALIAGLERLEQRQARASTQPPTLVRRREKRRPPPVRKRAIATWGVYRKGERITLRYTLSSARACVAYLNRLVGQKVYSYQKEDVA